MLALVTFAFFAVVVLVVVPWAPLKLGLLLGGTYWLARRPMPDDTGPLVLERMQGVVRLRDTAAILVMPMTAAATYAVAWRMDLAELAPDLLELFTVTQVFAGVVAYAVAARVALRMRHRSAPDQPASHTVLA